MTRETPFDLEGEIKAFNADIKAERLNVLIEEYARTTQFSRADLTDLAREVEDEGAFEWIVTAWMSGFRTHTSNMVAMYRSAREA